MQHKNKHLSFLKKLGLLISENQDSLALICGCLFTGGSFAGHFMQALVELAHFIVFTQSR